MKTEYSVEVLSVGRRDLEAKLNDFAADGWEVVQIIQFPDAPRMEIVLKRSVEKT